MGSLEPRTVDGRGTEEEERIHVSLTSRPHGSGGHISIQHGETAFQNHPRGLSARYLIVWGVRYLVLLFEGLSALTLIVDYVDFFRLDFRSCNVQVNVKIPQTAEGHATPPVSREHLYFGKQIRFRLRG